MCFMKANSSPDIPSHFLAPNYCLCFLSQAVGSGGNGGRQPCGPLNFLFSDISLAANSRVLICMVAA